MREEGFVGKKDLSGRMLAMKWKHIIYVLLFAIRNLKDNGFNKRKPKAR